MLTPKAKPGVPKLDVADTFAIGSVLTPKAKPKIPSFVVAVCPETETVGLITKLTLPTLVVAS